MSNAHSVSDSPTRISSVFLSKASVRLEKIYLLSAFLIAIGLSEMSLLRAVDFDMRDTVPVAAFVWMLTSLVCLMLMVYTEMFAKFPINWTLAIVSAQSMALCTMCFNWTSTDLYLAAGGVSAVVVINFCVYFWAAFMPLFLLPGYTLMVTATVLYIISYSLISIVVYVVDHKSFLALCDGISVFYIILLAVYGGTIIHDRRHDVFTDEILVSSTVICTFFFMMLHLVLSTLRYCKELYLIYGLL